MIIQVYVMNIAGERRCNAWFFCYSVCRVNAVMTGIYYSVRSFRLYAVVNCFKIFKSPSVNVCYRSARVPVCICGRSRGVTSVACLQTAGYIAGSVNGSRVVTSSVHPYYGYLRVRRPEFMRRKRGRVISGFVRKNSGRIRDFPV